MSDQITALRQLVFADTAIRQAHLLCEHIEALGPRDIPALWSPLLTGVIVTYMKPFGECRGLGRLPATFSQFPINSPHGQTHKDIADGRNWTFAHRDFNKGPTLLSTPEEQQTISEVILEFVKDGPTTIYTRDATWHPETIFRIRELCEFQSSRVDAAMRPLILALAGSKKYKAGKYVLGRDFP